MKPVAFFRTPEVMRLVARAARCAATPVSLHVFEEGKEGLRVGGVGACEACWRVSRPQGGNAACRGSRETAARDAHRTGTPTPFICHMGFACVIAEPLPGFSLTFGPYCPAEESRSLEADASEGFEKLGASPDDGFLESLDQVSILPAATVPGIMGWTLETLDALWSQAEDPDKGLQPLVQLGQDDSESGPAFGEAVSTEKRKHPRPHPTPPDPYQAAPIAAALAGGQQGQALALVRAVLSEASRDRRAAIGVRRARMLALAAAVLEAAERSELNPETCWARFTDLLDTVRRARTDAELVDAVMGILGILKRKAVREAAVAPGFPELSALVLEHLVDGITLNEVAAKLGQHPTAITHRLQRKFGMSYSEYVGRLRIDKAKELLRRTRLSVTEVGRRVGIGDTSNFVKLFRKFEAVTPVKYREQFGRKH